MAMQFFDQNDLIRALNAETEPEGNSISTLVRNTPDLDETFVTTFGVAGALHLAAKNNFLNSAWILLEARASVNIRTTSRETPLHLCSARKHCTDMLRLLLEYGANVNAKDLTGKTPLHEAAINQCVENVKILLKNGAEVDAVDSLGHTPLHFVSFGEPDADANLIDRQGLVPLHSAVEEHRVEVIQLLLSHSADANLYDNKGYKSLHLVALKNFQPIDAFRALIRGGATLNALDIRGHSPLFCAVSARNVEAVRELLRSGAPFEVADCLEVLKDKFSIQFLDEVLAISQELIRYLFINRPFSVEKISEELMPYHCSFLFSEWPNCLSKLYTFKRKCLTEVEKLSKMSCDCGNSSVWGSIFGCRTCNCDTHQAIFKFLFSGRKSHFGDVFFYKVRKEFLMEIAFNLMSYFEFKESKNRVMLNRDCMKEIECYVSFDSVVSFLQSKRSLMGVGEFVKFVAFTKGGSLDKSCSAISSP